MRDILISRDLPFDRSRVWAALTDGSQLALWLMPNDFRPIVGHRFTFKTDPAPGFDGIVNCEVLAIEPMRRIEYSWRGGPIDTVLSFRLSDIPSGTNLILRQTGFKGTSNLLSRIILGLGWRFNFKKLARAISTSSGELK